MSTSLSPDRENAAALPILWYVFNSAKVAYAVCIEAISNILKEISLETGNHVDAEIGRYSDKKCPSILNMTWVLIKVIIVYYLILDPV